MRVLFLSLALLGGCSRQVDDADATRGTIDKNATAARDATPAPAPRPSPIATVAPVAERADGLDESAADAAAVVARYHALIGARRYREAWRLWDRDGEASGMDARSFAASFTKYASYTAEVGPPGAIEAGAGQRYVTVPVRVSGRLKEDRGPFMLEGPVTLHRVADIDGATPAQRRWRISESDLRPKPAATDISTP